MKRTLLALAVVPLLFAACGNDSDEPAVDPEVAAIVRFATNHAGDADRGMNAMTDMVAAAEQMDEIALRAAARDLQRSCDSMRDAQAYTVGTFDKHLDDYLDACDATVEATLEGDYDGAIPHLYEMRDALEGMTASMQEVNGR